LRMTQKAFLGGSAALTRLLDVHRGAVRSSARGCNENVNHMLN